MKNPKTYFKRRNDWIYFTLSQHFLGSLNGSQHIGFWSPEIAGNVVGPFLLVLSSSCLRPMKHAFHAKSKIAPSSTSINIIQDRHCYNLRNDFFFVLSKVLTGLVMLEDRLTVLSERSPEDGVVFAGRHPSFSSSDDLSSLLESNGFGRPCMSAISFARLAYSWYDSMNNFPASSLRLDSGKGTISKHRMTLKTWQKVVSAVQSFLRVLTQMAPFDMSTFGW